MSEPPRDSDIPPDDPSDPAPKDSRRRRLVESVIPEILKRAVELGVEKAQEAPDNLKQFVGDMRLPKEIAHYLLQQIDETKNGLFRVVAKEIRDFLEHTNFAGEVQKLLTTVQFEVNTTIRFTPNDGPSPNKGKGKNAKDAKDKREEKKADARDELATDEPLEDASESAAEGEDEEDAPVTSLPRPELKTAVHVRRDERERATGAGASAGKRRRGAG